MNQYRKLKHLGKKKLSATVRKY